MESEVAEKIRKQQKRKLRVRANLGRKQYKLRLSVFRSSKHIYAQIIDDLQQKTIVSADSRSKDMKSISAPMELAKAVGQKLASKAKEHNLGPIVFDRGRYAFHGRVAALAESAREGGLKF